MDERKGYVRRKLKKYRDQIRRLREEKEELLEEKEKLNKKLNKIGEAEKIENIDSSSIVQELKRENQELKEEIDELSRENEKLVDKLDKEIPYQRDGAKMDGSEVSSSKGTSVEESDEEKIECPICRNMNEKDVEYCSVCEADLTL